MSEVQPGLGLLLDGTTFWGGTCIFHLSKATEMLLQVQATETAAQKGHIE